MCGRRCFILVITLNSFMIYRAPKWATSKKNKSPYIAPRPPLKIKFLPQFLIFFRRPSSTASCEYCTIVQGCKKMKLGAFSRINSAKCPASGAGNVREPRVMSGEWANLCACRSVCFSSQSIGDVSVRPLTW